MTKNTDDVEVRGRNENIEPQVNPPTADGFKNKMAIQRSYSVEV